LGLDLDKKKAVVAEVSAQVAKAKSIVVAEYRGLEVGRMTELRAKARKSGVYLRVLKNTLARRAVEGTPFAGLSQHIKGPLVYGISPDPVATAKVLDEFAKANEKLVIRAGAMPNAVISAKEVTALAMMPSREELLAKARAEVDLIIRQAGEQAAYECGVPGLPADLLKTLGRLKFRTSYGQNVLQHSIEASFLSAMIASEIGADVMAAKMGGLLHDIGKPATLADGHFHGHETVGAEMAGDLLRRLRMPRAISERVSLLVRHHMFTYEGTWSDAAVRRFITRIGRHALEELFELREADSIGSGIPADSFGLAELRRRVADQLESQVALGLSDLAINGDDLITELGLTTGPAIGLILDELLDRVIADPDLNDRPTLLVLAQSMLSQDG